jgi:hypothetical protein
MPERIYVPVGKPLDLTATVDGAPDVDSISQATFEVFRVGDGQGAAREVLATLTGTMKNRKAQAQWPSASGPADTDMSTLLHYGVRADDLAFDGDEEIVVYRDSVEVTAVGADDAPVPNALFKVTVRGDGAEPTSTTRRTDGNGVARVQRLPPGEIEIEWLDPFELRGWIQGDGPRRRARVARRTYKGEFRFPARGVETHEQLVNLPRDDDNWDWGHTMRVKVGVEKGAWGPNDRLYLKAVFKTTERTAPARTIVGGVQNGLTSTHDLVVGPDGTATFEVELGHGGGDEVTLHVGSTNQCADGTVKIVSWRKVFYQLTAPDIWNVAELPGPVKSAMDQEFEKAFIRLEQHQVVAWDSNTNPINYMRFQVGNRDVFKTTWDPIVFTNGDSPNFSNFRGNVSMFPRHVRDWCYFQIAFVSHLADSFPEDDYDITMTGNSSGWVPAKAGTLLGIALDRMVVGATMTWTATGTASTAAFDYRWITVDGDSNGKRFKVQIPPGAAGGAISRGNPLQLRLKLKAIKPSAAGRSIASTIATTWKPHKPRQMAYTLIHELGHSFNQSITSDTKVPGLDIADHDQRYGTGTGHGQHGHSGSHCRTGLSKPFRSAQSYSTVYSRFGAHGDCVMWGGALEEKHSGSAFCAKCMRFLKACEL